MALWMSTSAKSQGASRTSDLRPAITSFARRPCSMTRVADLRASSGSEGFRASHRRQASALMIISGQRLIDLVNDGPCEFADRCEAKGPGQFRPCVGKSLFGSLTFGDIGDDAFQFDIA